MQRTMGGSLTLHGRVFPVSTLPRYKRLVFLKDVSTHPRTVSKSVLGHPVAIPQPVRQKKEQGSGLHIRSHTWRLPALVRLLTVGVFLSPWWLWARSRAGRQHPFISGPAHPHTFMLDTFSRTLPGPRLSMASNWLCKISPMILFLVPKCLFWLL